MFNGFAAGLPDDDDCSEGLAEPPDAAAPVGAVGGRAVGAAAPRGAQGFGNGSVFSVRDAVVLSKLIQQFNPPPPTKKNIVSTSIAGE